MQQVLNVYSAGVTANEFSLQAGELILHDKHLAAKGVYVVLAPSPLGAHRPSGLISDKNFPCVIQSSNQVLSSAQISKFEAAASTPSAPQKPAPWASSVSSVCSKVAACADLCILWRCTILCLVCSARRWPAGEIRRLPTVQRSPLDMDW